MLIDAVKVLCDVGVKVTIMVQLEPALTVPQLLLWAKSLLPAPAIVIAEMARVALPLFITVTLRGELVVPRAWFANIKLPGERVTPGPRPVPVRGTSC